MMAHDPKSPIERTLDQIGPREVSLDARGISSNALGHQPIAIKAILRLLLMYVKIQYSEMPIAEQK